MPVTITPPDSDEKTGSDELEDLFNLPSYTSKTVGDNMQSDVDKAEAAQLGQGFLGTTPSKPRTASKNKSLLRRRVQTSLATTMITGMIGILGSGAAYIVGPGHLQMLHAALDRFNFGPFQDQSSRIDNQIIRRMFIPDARLRVLGVRGRATLEKFDAALKKTGYEIKYDRFTGDIQEIRHPDGRVENLRTGEVNDFERSRALRRVYDDVDMGKFRISAVDRSHILKGLKVRRFALFSERRRALRERAGNARQSFHEFYSEKIRHDDARPRTLSAGRTAQDQLDEDDAALRQQNADMQNAMIDADDANAAGASTITDTPAADRPTARARFKSNIRTAAGIGAAGAAGAVVGAVIGFGCQAEAAKDEVADNIEKDIVQPAAETHASLAAADSELKVGALESANNEDIAGMSSLYNNTVDGEWQSMLSARAGLRAIGSNPDRTSDPGLPATLFPDIEAATAELQDIVDIYNNIPGYSAFCRFLQNDILQAILTPLGFLDPVGLVADTAIQELLVGPQLEGLINRAQDGRWFDPLTAGPHLMVNFTDMAYNMSAAFVAAGSGALVVSNEEMGNAREKILEKRKSEFAKLPLYKRLFSFEDPESMMVQATLRAPRSTTKMVASLSPLSMLDALFSKPALAQSATEDEDENGDFNNYAIAQRLFPESTMQKIESGEIDVIALMEWELEDPDGLAAAEEEFGECFDTPPHEYTNQCETDDPDGLEVYGVWRMVNSFMETADCAAADDCPGGSSSASSGAGSCEEPSGTPKDIIDNITLPIANEIGFPHTVEQIEAANEAHSLNVAGSNRRSDHKGPPEEAWAADYGNGDQPTPEMDQLAQDLADCFSMDWSGSGVVSSNLNGYRFNMLYKTYTGGNHYNHVHIGVRVE